MAAHSTDNAAADSPLCNPVGSITCSTSWTYRLVGLDGLGGETAATSAVTITNGPSARTVYDYNQLTWNVADANTVAWKIFSCHGASCTPTLTAVIPLIYTYSGGGLPATQTWWDMGFDFGVDSDLGTSLPSGATRRNLYTTISSGGGTTTLVLGAAAATGTFTLKHDDSVPFNAAITAACNAPTDGGQNGLEIFVPSGVYPIGQTLSIYKCIGIKLKGAGLSLGVTADTVLRWVGPTGGTGILANQYQYNTIEGVQLTQINGNTPGIGLALDEYDAGGGVTIASTHFTFAHSSITHAGIGIMISNRSASNVSEGLFDDVYVDNQGYGGIQWGYGAGWAGYYFNSMNILDTRLTHGSTGGHNYGIYLAAGSFHSYGQSFGDGGIAVRLDTYVSAPVTIIAPYDEVSQRFLWRPNLNAAVSPVSIIGGNLNASNPVAFSVLDGNTGVGYYLAFKGLGPVTLRGNSFFNNISTWRAWFDAGAGATSVVSDGNHYPNSTPFAGQASIRYHLSQTGDTYDAGSGAVNFPNRTISPPPSVSTCGTGSPSVSGNNYSGAIVVGGGTVTACTLTFSTLVPFIHPPNCVLTDTSTKQALGISAASATAITFNAATDMHGDTVTYACPGN